jgi:pimeloyl-ACP methyl ester carboxylesterase
MPISSPRRTPATASRRPPATARRAGATTAASSLAVERRPASATPPDSLIRFRAGAGEPLVLIHGLGLSWRSWKPVLPPLTRVHEVVALDVPGFGTAPPLADRVPTIAALTDTVEAELDRGGLDRVHVAGNSLGGWIALELGRRGRAASVVALSPSGLETPAERVAVIAVNELMRARNVAAAPAAALVTADLGSRNAMLGALHGRPWRLPAPDAVAEIRDFASAPGFQATLAATTGSHAPTGLGDICVPARICFGTVDVMIGALTAPRFAAAIPGAELVPLPGCGHVPMGDDPGLVAGAIIGLTAPTAARNAVAA